MIGRILSSRGKVFVPALVGFLAIGISVAPVMGSWGQASARGGREDGQGFNPGRGNEPGRGPARFESRSAPGRPPQERNGHNRVAPSRPAPSRPPDARFAPSPPVAPYVAQGRSGGHRPGPGVINRLPEGHGRAYYKGNPYYFHGGRYYRPYGRGYVVVAPPRRMIVPWLPLGFATLVLAGITYYSYMGVYYQRVPTGYVIVDPPVGAPAPPVVSTAYANVTVIAAALNMRQGPGSNYPVVFVVNLGATLSVLATAPGWLYVQTATGQLGWVDQRFTSPLQPGASG